MPNFNYLCSKCMLVTEDYRSFENREKPMKCPGCGAKAKQTFSTPRIDTELPEDKWAREHEVLGNGVRSNG